MKKLKICLLIVVSILFICASTINKTFSLSKDYKISISGTSNIHDWTENIETVSGNCVVSNNDDGSFNIDTLSIKMDVHSIKSDMGAIMNDNTYKALKAETYPQIVFILNQPIKSIQLIANKKNISTKGNLTIAGVTNGIDINVKVLMKDDKTISVEGIQKINMTDYGVKPPTALFGTLETGNEITLNFKTIFVKI